MSAFGRRSGAGASGQRPSFGVARPMQGGGSAAPAEGGTQFPPIDIAAVADLTTSAASMDAMARLTSRQDASGEAASSRVGEEAPPRVARKRNDLLQLDLFGTALA